MLLNGKYRLIDVVTHHLLNRFVVIVANHKQSSLCLYVLLDRSTRERKEEQPRYRFRYVYS